MRWVICLALAFAGCVVSLPGDDAVTADLACEAAREVLRLRSQPEPTPQPQPDECCRECRGTGYITHGDGHKTPCPCPPTCKCKKTKSVLVSPCPDGKCKP